MSYRQRYDHGGIGIGVALRPIRDMFDFAGRATRTQVVLFWIISSLATVRLGTIEAEDLLAWLFVGAIALLWNFLWGFPWIALFVRRLHDQDRSGWWMLLLAAVFFAAWTGLFLLPEDPDSIISIRLPGAVPQHPAQTPLSYALCLAIAAAALAQLALLLLPGTEGPNRYGPDPRLDSEPQDTVTT